MNGKKLGTGSEERQNVASGIMKGGKKPSTLSRMELALESVTDPIDRMRVKLSLSKIRQANTKAAQDALRELEIRGFEFYAEKYLNTAYSEIADISREATTRISVEMPAVKIKAANAAESFVKATGDLRAVLGKVVGDQNEPEESEK